MGLLESLLGGAGYALDTPGALLRGGIGNVADLVTGEDRVGARASGRDLLERLGLLDTNTEGLDAGDVAGLGVDIATDPLTYILPGLTRAVKAGATGASAAAKAGATAAGSRAASLAEKLGLRASDTGVGRWGSVATPGARARAWVDDMMGKVPENWKFNAPGGRMDDLQKYVAKMRGTAGEVGSTAATGERGWTRAAMDRMPSFDEVLGGAKAGFNAGMSPIKRVASPVMNSYPGQLAALKLLQGQGNPDDYDAMVGGEPDMDADDASMMPMAPEQRREAILRQLGEGVNSMQYDEPNVGMVTIRRPKQRRPTQAELVARMLEQLQVQQGRM